MLQDYYDVGPKIKSGDVILWDFGILTPIIKRITGKDYLRCGLAWCLPNGEITVLGTGIISPMTFVKSLRKKTPFYWVSTNLEITNDVRRYALEVLRIRPTLKERFENIIDKIRERDFNAACAKFLTAILYKGKFNVLIHNAEYSISELVSLMHFKKLSMVRVTKL